MAKDIDTVGWFLAHGRTVIWTCDVLYHQGEVDLHAVAQALGPEFSFANRRPPCRIAGCPGRARFADASSMWPRRLDTIDDYGPVGMAYKDAVGMRAEALGFRVMMGKWIAPDAEKPAAG